MLQNEEHRVIMETAANDYMNGVAQVVGRIASNLSKYYLKEPVKQAIERGEKFYAGQIVFSRDELIDVRLNEQVRGSVRAGNRTYQMSRVPASVRVGNVDYFVPVEHEMDLIHVFELLCSKEGKLDSLRSNIGHHNLHKIPFPNSENAVVDPDAPHKIIQQQVCPFCGKYDDSNPRVPHKKYCSEKCRQSAYKRRLREKNKKNKKNEVV